MKKFLFFFVLVLACTIVLPAFGQLSNSDIAKIISQSQEYNGQVVNPDLIYPKQILTYQFLDGYVDKIEVEKGDYQWKLVKKLDKFIKEHGPIVDPDSAKAQSQPIKWNELEPFPWWIGVPWGWLLALLAIVLIGAKLLQIRYKARNQNPITAGPAQVPGGVRDSGAYSRMHKVAQNQFPGSRLDIRSIRRGKLSGLATVHYASGKPKKLRLKKTPAYAGEVVVNGNTETIYFLQGCGNDARQGNFMSGNLVFEPDVVVNEDGSESPLPLSSNPTPETSSIEQTPMPDDFKSEYDGQVGQAMKLAEKVIADNPSHEVSIEIPKGDGSFKMTIKAQYQKKPSRADEKEKS